MRIERRVACAAIALGLGGCDGAPFSTVSSAGPNIASISTVTVWLIWSVSAIIVAMGMLVLVGALRRKGTLAEHLPLDTVSGKAWILIGGIAIPVVALTALFFVTMGTLRALPRESGTPEITVRVTGHQWWWDVRYAYPGPAEVRTANEIHVPVGTPIRIELQSADVIHSFWVPRLFGKLDVIPGVDNTFVLRVDEPGVYWGECAEYCGLQHANMRLVVVAENRDEYDAWLLHQREPAASPATPQLTDGRDLFEQSACALCHRVRGTRAQGRVAPDLTHVGSRLAIGAGALPNTRARLQAWIVNAQSLKPGIRMPALSEFTGPELNALAAYVESLE